MASINNKNPKISTKRSKQPSVATTVPSGTQCHHWGILYFGVYLQIFDPGPSNPTAFLGHTALRWIQTDYRVVNGRPHLPLYRTGAWIHYLWLYSDNTAKKVCYFWQKLAHWASSKVRMRNMLNSLAYDVQRAEVHQKNKMMNLQCFGLFMCIWCLLTLLEVFLLGKLTKPCRHARPFPLLSQRCWQVLTTKTQKFQQNGKNSHL